MIVLGSEAEALDIPGTEPHKALPGLELQIDLITGVSLESIDLIRGVDGHPHPHIPGAGRGRAVAQCGRRQQQRAGGECENPDTHGVGP